MITTLNPPNDCRVINVGESRFSDAKIDLQVDDLSDQAAAIRKIKDLLVQKKYIVEYYL